MSFLNEIEKWGPQIPLEHLIVEVNKIFHSYEAQVYDSSHPEVHIQLPPIWKEMLQHAMSLTSPQLLHILDYGCGTGFEAQQAIENIPKSRIGSLVCYDPSKEMLSKCRKKIEPIYSAALFADDIENIPTDVKYNLLLSNSLLHHLPKPLEAIEAIQGKLTTDCIWCAGHEPSNRFYKNPECIKLLNEYKLYNRLIKILQPYEVMKRILMYLGIGKDIRVSTAKEAYRRNLFASQPPAGLIGLMVDYHVAHSLSEVHDGRGFCIDDLSSHLDGKWRLSWKKTYSFMGPFSEINLPLKWKTKAINLEKKFPDNGANFSVVWRRSSAEKNGSEVNV